LRISTARPEPAPPRRARWAAVVLLSAALVPAALARESTPQHEVEGRLMCYCGCSDLTVRVCTCGTADGIREEITDRLARGETPDQVVAAFVARHGDRIRSAPDKSGFELIAWVTPFVVLLLAGSALVLVVRRWGSLRPATPPASQAATAEPTTAERKALERVRRELKEGR
jgi:cytochrome c-type biogenesis protein CcmH